MILGTDFMVLPMIPQITTNRYHPLVKIAMRCALIYAKPGFKSFWSMCRATQRSKAMATLLKKKLQGMDWQIGDAADFLHLSAEESALIDIRLSLAQAAKQSQVQHALSQTELAKHMKSSQSRIGKIEATALSVSMGLMVRALLASGPERRGICVAATSRLVGVLRQRRRCRTARPAV
jgi:hypothetical protein